MSRYGFIITTYNDADETAKMFSSLKKTIPAGESYAISVIDGGSTDEQRVKIENEIGAINYTHKDLSSALNAGYYSLLGFDPDGSNINFFVEEGIGMVDYMFWIHQDMKFEEYNWANKLIFCYEFCFPMFGRMGPGTRNIDGSHPDIPLRGGNQCPTLMSTEFLLSFIEEYGHVYNPDFIRCGGYEDWDMGRKMLNQGYGFGICSLVDVWHEGMGTRKTYNTSEHQRYNADVYYKAWGTWEQPGFEINLDELGADLKSAYEKEFKDRWYN